MTQKVLQNKKTNRIRICLNYFAHDKSLIHDHVCTSMCKQKRNNICYQLILIVFLTDVPKPMTTLVGRFLPVPAKLNLITQQVSHCFNKKKKKVHLGIIFS